MRYIVSHKGLHGITEPIFSSRGVKEVGRYCGLGSTTARCFSITDAPSREVVLEAHASAGIPLDEVMEVKEVTFQETIENVSDDSWIFYYQG